MSKLSKMTRRLLLGQPFRSDKLSHTLLPKTIALPVFASDALSSVAYAPEATEAAPCFGLRAPARLHRSWQGT